MGVINFHKYQGTGNDFIMIDDRSSNFDLGDLELVSSLCDRKFGIGADGVILIRDHPDYDFEMIYFNPDGSQSLCGNGSRCAVRFANRLGLIGDSCNFLAIDGSHQGYIKDDLVHINMPDVPLLPQPTPSCFVNTGSPHHVEIVADVSSIDVIQAGSSIRYSTQYEPAGANVNFVEVQSDHLKVRTYERGVENETLSCGTGVTAVALALSGQGFESPVPLVTKGGNLHVSFKVTPEGFKQVYLIGPAAAVFQGTYEPK